MKFPVIIRHRREKATIYGKSAGYAFYRLGYYVAGQRRIRSFKTYGEAKTEAERIVRDLAEGSQAAALNGEQSRDALAAMQRLDALRQSTGRRVSLLAAVSEFAEASVKAHGRNLVEIVEGYQNTVASVKRKGIAEAVEEFIKTDEPRTKAGEGQRAQLSSEYVDFARLYRFVLAGAFFVTRAKANLQWSRLESRPIEPGTGVRSDQVVWLRLLKSIEHYPERLRRVSYRDPESGKALVFLTNNFDLPALTIAQLYKCRWRVELFFKWVKQNLRIKHFFGTSDNAVKTQVWIAICVYVLVAIVRKELRLELSLSQILQVLSVNVFEQVPLTELVAKTASQNEAADSHNQLVFNIL